METTITLTEQQVELIKDLLNGYMEEEYCTKTDDFICHEIIKKLTPDEL